ncbi:MAG: hypothetical protein ACT4QC_23485 [Planctomycetaceae bacterium]
MKNLLARIKGYDYKGFFLKHGEKVGMAIVGAIVVGALAITSWSGYAKVPDQFVERADKADRDLLMNNFPQSKRADFPLLTADQQMAKLVGPIELARFEHDEPFSPKLFAYRLPAEEPDVLTPIELIARPIVFAMEESVPESATPDESPQPEPRRVAETKSASAKKGRERQDLDAVASTIAGQLGIGDIGDLAGGFSAGSGKSRTMPAVVLVGRIDRRKQLERLQQKLHLDSVYEAVNYLEYIEFRVERQRAVRGPNPWPNDDASWKLLNIENSIDVISQAFDFDPEVVPAENTDAQVTSPLPRRLDGQWTAGNASHPNLPKLDEIGQTVEGALNVAVAEFAEDEEEETEAPKKGFGRLQRDVNSMRSQALAGGGDVRERMQKLLGGVGRKGGRGPAGLEQMMNSLPGFSGMLSSVMGGAAGARGGAGGAGAAGLGGLESLLSSVGGMGMLSAALPGAGGKSPRGGGAAAGIPPDLMGLASSMGLGGLSSMLGAAGPGGRLPTSYTMLLGGGPAGSIGADAILFRYFDFDVEPGECYRYRVKLVIRNPSFEEEFVSNPDVAAGETRESQSWSPPSTPAAVPRDVEYALNSVDRRGMTTLDAIQHDPETGMLISGALRMTQGAGQYVGGSPRVKRLRPIEGTNELEEVLFTSRDVFLDSAAPSELLRTVQEDLKLSDKEMKALKNSQALSQAVTVSRFGEILALDADSRKQLKGAQDRYNQQLHEFKEKEADKAQGALGANDVLSQLFGVDNKATKKKGPLNPLKNPRGLRGYMGMGGDGGFDPAAASGRGKRGARSGR